jgi:hypothetical protein
MSAAAANAMEMDEATSQKSAVGKSEDNKGNADMGMGDENVEEKQLENEDVEMGEIEGTATMTAASMMIPVSPVVAENKTADTAKPMEVEKNEQAEAQAMGTIEEVQTEVEVHHSPTKVAENKTDDSAKPKEDEKDEQGEAPAMTMTEVETEVEAHFTPAVAENTTADTAKPMEVEKNEQGEAQALTTVEADYFEAHYSPTIMMSPLVAENKTDDSAKPKEDEKNEQGETQAMTTTEAETEVEAHPSPTKVLESDVMIPAPPVVAENKTDDSAKPKVDEQGEAQVMATTEPDTKVEAHSAPTIPMSPVVAENKTADAANPKEDEQGEARAMTATEVETEVEALYSPTKVLESDGGVGVLSEEQTNAALEALQEASTIVIEAKEAEEAKANEKKRKATDPPEKIPAKKRGPPVRVAWTDRIEMLRKYREDFGNLLIPIRYKLNPSLGKFVHNTREQYKLFHKKTPLSYKKKCSLTAERIQQLEDLGFVWSTERTKRQNEDWEARLIQLKQYKEKNGVSRKVVYGPRL